MIWTQEKEFEAGCLNDEAVELQARGLLHDSLDKFKRALQLYEEIQDSTGIARCLNGVGAILKDIGEVQEARRYLELALTARQAARDTLGEAITLLTIGPIYANLGESGRAQSCLNMALSVFQSSPKYKDLEGQAYYNLGCVLIHADAGRARGCFQRSFDIAKSYDNLIEQAKCFNCLGIVSGRLGFYEEAFTYYQASIKIARSLNNAPLEASALLDIGFFYHGIGELSEAWRYLQESAKLYLQGVIVPRVALAAIGLAQVLREAGSSFGEQELSTTARSYVEMAIDISRNAGNTLELAHALLQLSFMNHLACDNESAVSLAQEALQLSETSKNLYGVVGALQMLGVATAAMRNIPRAIGYLERALRISKESSFSYEEATAYQNLSAINAQDENLVKSYDFGALAMDIFDRLRTRISTDSHNISFFNQRGVQDAYYHSTALLVALYQKTCAKHYAHEAFHTCERRRARALLDLLTESRRQQDHAQMAEPISPTQLLQAPVLHSRVFHVDKIRHTSPPVRIEAVQDVLPEDTVILEYSLQNHESYLWGIYRGGVAFYVLPSGNSIRNLVWKFLRSMRDSDLVDFAAQAYGLYQMILAPAANIIVGKKLVIVPDDILQHLPFQMLVAEPPAYGVSRVGPVENEDVGAGENERGMFSWLFGNRLTDYRSLAFLLKTYVITYAPSSTVYTMLQGQSNIGANDEKKQPSFIGFAPVHSVEMNLNVTERKLKALPRTKHEVQSIAALFNQATLRLDREATKSRVMDENLSAYDFIHFATHGVATSNRPEYSALVLHPEDKLNQMLYAFEILNFELKADLVTLSACETAGARRLSGEGLIGLSRAFLGAGARNICATLWEVEDVSTSVLMMRFYEKMVCFGLTPAVALRDAQCNLLESKRWSSPYYWASFVLIGG